MRVWEQNGRRVPLPAVAARRPRVSAMRAARFELETRQEQAPNPDSRVTLSSEKDAMGMPRATRLAVDGARQTLHADVLRAARSGAGSE